MRSYTVVGAGAVGLLYGTRLAAAGHPVRWVVRSGADRIREDGISVRSEGQLLAIAPGDVEVHTDPGRVPPSDVVLVALKTTANADLARLVGPAVAPGATVAMFQNGLGIEEQARSAIPQASAVLGVMCFVCAHRVGPGRVDHLDYGAVTIGELGGTMPSHSSVALAGDLVSAGVEASVADDLGGARWRKLVWNVPFNGLSVVLDASTDDLLANAGTRALVADLMDEVIVAANAIGHRVERDFRDVMLETTDAMTPYAPSMKLDHDAGLPLELGAIYDAPLAAGQQAGAPMTRVELLARALHFVDERVRHGPD